MKHALTKSLLSNLLRTKDHPTLNTVLEVADAFSLTIDGAHRLFGYELEGLQEFDLKFNAGRTHIIETYAYKRDLRIHLPSRLAASEMFSIPAALHDLVLEWHKDVPVRSLEFSGWQHPSAFYVRVGTEDSLGGSLPAGAIALVVPVDQKERSRPNTKSIYLLQFGNGYRCSRCVVTGKKLLLLSTGRRQGGPQEFLYPGTVRIAGRVRMFTLSLPVPNYPSLRSLPLSRTSAPLILPWEHTSIDRLFRAKHRRFRRSKTDLQHSREALESMFHRKLSPRTERRYRRPTSSMPHVDLLIQLTLTHLAR